MQTLNLTKVDVYLKNKEGKEYVGKFGPYARVVFQCLEYPSERISALCNLDQVNLFKVGFPVEGEVTKDEKDGKVYLNFKLPTEKMVNNSRLEEMAKWAAGIEKWKKQVDIDLEALKKLG